MKILKVIAFVVILALTISIAKDFVIKSIVCSAATRITGARVNIDSLSLGIFKQSLRIRNLRIYNPPGFSPGLLLDLPDIRVDYDLPALLRGELHLWQVDVDLKEVVLERDFEGKLNVDALKVTHKQEEGAREKKHERKLAMRIELLNLNIGKIVSRDYTGGTEPVVLVYDLRMKKSYKNITSAQQLVALILAESMKHAGIRGAEIYGAALLAGVGVIPLAIASKFMEKDNSEQDFDIPVERIYAVTLEVLNRIGKIGREDSNTGVIEAEVYGSSVVIRTRRIADNKSQITVSARKYLLPKPEIAGGVLYQISGALKHPGRE